MRVSLRVQRTLKWLAILLLALVVVVTCLWMAYPTLRGFYLRLQKLGSARSIHLNVGRFVRECVRFTDFLVDEPALQANGLWGTEEGEEITKLYIDSNDGMLYRQVNERNATPENVFGEAFYEQGFRLGWTWSINQKDDSLEKDVVLLQLAVLDAEGMVIYSRTYPIKLMNIDEDTALPEGDKYRALYYHPYYGDVGKPMGEDYIAATPSLATPMKTPTPATATPDTTE